MGTSIHVQLSNYECKLIMTNRDGPNPYALIPIEGSLMPQQAYDITVQIDMPRSPPNLKMGNFMVDLVMLSPTYDKPVARPSPTDPFDIRSWIPAEAILFSARRPAILTYQSDVVRIGKQIASLPSYLLGWRQETERIELHMAEGISFQKSWASMPTKLYLDLQSRGHDIQIYAVNLILRARFTGMRWLMYNHRILSFIIFTSAFWAAEMLFALLALIVLQSAFSAGDEDKVVVKDEYNDDSSTRIKAEGEEEFDLDDLDLSDTPRSFPTYGRQAPLHFVPKIKTEDDSEGMVSDEVRTHPRTAEADDESEEPVDIRNPFSGGRSDSGLGTSYSESGLSGVQKRRSKGKMNAP